MPTEKFHPAEIRQFPHDIRQQVAESASHVIRDIYGDTYPLSAKDSKQLNKDIANKKVHASMILDEVDGSPEVLAMATIVMLDNPFDAPVRIAELGRAGKRSTYRGGSVRKLLTERVEWARTNLDVDMLVSITRSASTAHSGISSSGKGVQSVWWGGRKYGENMDLIATRVGYDYRLGQIEPFTGFAIPLSVEKWREQNSPHTTYIGNEHQADTLLTLFYEHTQGAFVPKVDPTAQPTTPELTFHQLQEASNITAGKFTLTDHPSASVDYSHVSNTRHAAFSQVIIVEADWATQPKGGAACRFLEDAGWTLTGWEPSRLEPGVVCPAFGRINASHLDELVEPMHHTQYFDDVGLGGTRQKLDTMYETMKQKAYQ